MKTMNYKQGFTLIELLVVIAIIGILSSVVITQLASARNKGADAGIISNLNAIRTQFEINYTGTGTPYGTVATGCGSSAVSYFGTDLTIRKAIQRAVDLSAASDEFCNVTSNAWVASVQLKTSTTAAPKYYCVDSTGNTAELPTQILGVSKCQ